MEWRDEDVEASREYRCPICKKKYSSRPELEHLQRTHPKGKRPLEDTSKNASRKKRDVKKHSSKDTMHQQDQAGPSRQEQEGKKTTAVPGGGRMTGEESHQQSFGYALLLDDLLGTPRPPTPRTPTPPKTQLDEANTKEIPTEVQGTAGPDPRLFKPIQRGSAATEAQEVMEKAREKARSTTASHTSCRWAIQRIQESEKKYIITTETAVGEDGRFYRMTKEEFCEKYRR